MEVFLSLKNQTSKKQKNKKKTPKPILVFNLLRVTETKDFQHKTANFSTTFSVEFVSL
jgi:hypothetical protein